ncbi:permease [Bacillus coahuilensis m2-6]|uniref:NCS2 family permease n=1 Tax=Bacillus coahuilensis TaxID=408580 RepID=UPI0007501D49|nr:NCS2 family permease [Bacillus coahuilensis]KUP08175.1 permease [Bacillus coahuilensis m2-6]
MKTNGGIFKLKEHETSVKTELFAGVIGFATLAYIIIVNSLILTEAGIPYEGAVIATILTSAIGSYMMAFWANAPILLVPGMGINAMFTYTLVGTMGFSWQEALVVVVISGVLFSIVAFTKLATVINSSIPKTLKEAITVGLGFFLLLIGLEKGGIVVKGDSSIVAIGDFSELTVLLTIITFIVAILLFLRNVPGNFLWSILFGTSLALIFGIRPDETESSIHISDYIKVFGQLSFESFLSIPMLAGVFSLSMVLIFENIGLVNGHVDMLGQQHKYKKALQANAVSAFLSGIFGTSPTVSSVESSSAISSGGKTGLTAFVTGSLFILSILFISYIKWIPDLAIAPVLMIIGLLMIQNIRHMELSDLSEAIPALLIICMIPFTYSIVDGIAIGFILYPLLKITLGKGKDVSVPLYIIATLFLVNLVVSVH